jgi:signal transduction histidine kinase
MVATLDTAIDMTRNLSKRLRPAALSLGIVPALKWLAQDFTVNTGIVCNFYALAEFAKLDEHRSLMIFRIVQESLTNVLRHAKANQIDVTMSQEREYIEVKIRDNGKGFNPDHNDPISSGIIGMKERALALQGTLDIVSAENAGTLVTLHLPLKALY